MATPRYKLVDEEHAACYHVTSRCVRRAWLCGYDSFTQRDYSYRKRWLVDRMKHLARCFAVEIFGYAVMDNHFHMVLRYDPKACESWTDEEVARRWVEAFPPTAKGEMLEERKAEARQLLMEDADGLERARRTLGSLSHFMKHLKQPIARRANQEDDCLGHFFEQRFYSGALLSEEALLAAMVYVDLNPIRARQGTRAHRLSRHFDWRAASGAQRGGSCGVPRAVGVWSAGQRNCGHGAAAGHFRGVHRTAAGHG